MVQYKTKRMFSLNINEREKLGELKKKIKDHYEIKSNVLINIQCGLKIFDKTSDEKSLEDLGIAKIVIAIEHHTSANICNKKNS